MTIQSNYEDSILCIFSACKCMACGKEEHYQRMGCSCWDMARMSTDKEYLSSLKMENGMYYKTPENTAKYISNNDLKMALSNGIKVFDPDRNEITLADFE